MAPLRGYEHVVNANFCFDAPFPSARILARRDRGGRAIIPIQLRELPWIGR